MDYATLNLDYFVAKLVQGEKVGYLTAEHGLFSMVKQPLRALAAV
jgi:hypothetical protein